jgi:hypothetical protein
MKGGEIAFSLDQLSQSKIDLQCEILMLKMHCEKEVRSLSTGKFLWQKN